ncbi:MAG: MarR family transcriptional regulator [Candidatus Omnitrophota bacterium]
MMNTTKDFLNEREFELVNIVGSQLAANQRDLSRHMNLSLGMTNMVLRRLITKGYIRIKQLNRRKVEYILTPKGFTEKMRKCVKYTLKTINSIGFIKKNVLNILNNFYVDGIRKFYVLGVSDLGGVIEIVLRENFKGDYILANVQEITADMMDGVILICREDVQVPAGLKVVNMIEELAKDFEGLAQVQ